MGVGVGPTLWGGGGTHVHGKIRVRMSEVSQKFPWKSKNAFFWLTWRWYMWNFSDVHQVRISTGGKNDFQTFARNRSKVTKMSHGKAQAAKKEVSTGMKELIKEQLAQGVSVKGKKGKGAR